MNGLRKGSGAWMRRAVAVVAVAAAAASGNARAGEPLSITRVYGAGVHAYFSGDYLRSYDDLTDSIEAGSMDPRTRYFRGLAALALGRLDEAEADFSKGALLESAPDGNWPVSRSLERVQGYPRLQLERHRAQARVAALRRGGVTIQGSEDVLRRRAPSGLPSAGTESGNAFADESGEGRAPAEPPVTREEMPPPAAEGPVAGDEPAGAGTDLEPVMERPAGESAEGASVELPGDGGAPPVEEPSVETGGAGESTEPAAPAGGEDPFGDNTPPPADDAGAPMPEAGTTPAAGGE